MNGAPTITTGVFFVTRQPPIASFEGTTFTLTLHVVDRQGPNAVEPYVVRWRGEDARLFWRLHQCSVQAGTPLKLVLHNPRSFPGARTPETHATVASCEIAPLSPSWLAGESVTEPPRAEPV